MTHASVQLAAINPMLNYLESMLNELLKQGKASATAKNRVDGK